MSYGLIIRLYEYDTRVWVVRDLACYRAHTHRSRCVACDISYCVMYCRTKLNRAYSRVGFKTAYARFFVFGGEKLAKTFLTA